MDRETDRLSFAFRLIQSFCFHVKPSLTKKSSLILKSCENCVVVVGENSAGKSYRKCSFKKTHSIHTQPLLDRDMLKFWLVVY